MDAAEPALPRVLYRYRNPSPYAMKALLCDTLTCSTPNVFNDYLDCSIRYDSAKLCARLLKLKRFRKRLIYRYFVAPNIGMLDQYDTYEAYKSKHDSLVQQGNETIFTDAFQPTLTKYVLEEYLKRLWMIKGCLGILSLTANPNSQIMWAHYASDCSGFLLGYETNDLRAALLNKRDWFAKDLKGIEGIYPMKYVESLPDKTDLAYRIVSTPTDGGSDDFAFLAKVFPKERLPELLEILTTKTKEWSYEQEVRVIALNDHRMDGEIVLDTKKKRQFFELDCLCPPVLVAIGEKASATDAAAICLFAKAHKEIKLFCQQRKTMVSKGASSYNPITNEKEMLDLVRSLT